MGKYKHGMIDLPSYISWENMKQRCLNPRHTAYASYGGRGIKVCEEWLDFKNFLRDMGDRPEGMTLDRINVNGNYEPGNCRWATRTTQSRNIRPYAKSKSGIVGVYWNKESRRWIASITADGVKHHLGTFVGLDEAIAVRKAAESKYHPRTAMKDGEL